MVRGQRSDGSGHSEIDKVAKHAISDYIFYELECKLNGLPWRGFALCECFLVSICI